MIGRADLMMDVKTVLIVFVTARYQISGQEGKQINSNLNDNLSNASVSTTNQIDLGFLVLSHSALLQIASVNDTLRKLLSLPVERSGVNLYDIPFCLDYDTAKRECEYRDYKLLLVNNKWPYLETEKKRSKIPLCGIGFGDSGCGSFGILTSPCGIISYKTSNVGMNQDCEWVVRTNDGPHIRLDFESFNINYCGRQCICDNLTVYDRVYGAEKGYTFCGRRGPFSIVTVSNIIRITFYFNESLPSTGFRLKYQVVNEKVLPTSPPTKFATNNGNITISSVPNRSEEETLIYQWHIRVDEAMKINMTWYLRGTCPNDTHLYIYEGPTAADKDLSRHLTDGRFKGRLISRSFQVSLQLNYNDSCIIETFVALYTAISVLEKDLVTFHMKSDSLNIMQTKNTSVSVSMREKTLPFVRFYRYISPKGYFVSLNVTEYIFNGPNTDDCENEGFVIWDGVGDSIAKYGPFCGVPLHKEFFGGEHGVEIHSESNTLTLLIYSYGPARDTSVKFSIHASSCIGIFSLNKFVKLDYVKIDSNISGQPLIININSKNEICFHLQSFPSHRSRWQHFVLIFDEPYSKFSYTQPTAKHNQGCYCTDLCYCQITSESFTLRIRINKYHHKYYNRNNLFQEYDFILGTVGGLLTADQDVMYGYFTLQAPSRFRKDHFFSIEITCRVHCLEIYPFVVQMHDTIDNMVVTGYLREVSWDALPYRLKSYWCSGVTIHIILHSNVLIAYTLMKSLEPKPDLNTHVCPQNINAIELYRDTCYTFHNNIGNHQVTWVMAEQTCKKRGGRLLSIKDQQQLLFIKGMVKRQLITRERKFDEDNVCIYIGLAASEEDDRWTDGTPAAYTEYLRPLLTKQSDIPSNKKFDVALKVSSLLQPDTDPTTKCTGMLVRTFMSTEWIRIACHYPYPNASFICEYPANNRKDTLNKPKHKTRIDEEGFHGNKGVLVHKKYITKLTTATKRCPLGYNLMQEFCYRLITSTSLINEPFNCSAARNICSKFNGFMVRKVESFPTVLLHIWLHVYEYGDIWIGQCEILTYNETEGTWDIMSSSTDIKYVLHVICETDALTYNYSCDESQFECNDGTCVLETHVCDGKADCLDGEDEIDTSCTNDTFTCSNQEIIPFSKYCDFAKDCRDNSDEKNCTVPWCPDNNRKCDNGQCIESYKFGNYKIDCMDSSDEKPVYRQNVTCNTFMCYSGTCLPESLKGNMRVDCLGGLQEDERLEIREVKRGKWIDPLLTQRGFQNMSNMNPYCPSSTGTQSRCRLDHVLCFQRHFACIYDVNEYGYISSCPDGDHLRNCRSFECPGSYKCTGSYCIPFHKVCNGKPDCPDGKDETDCTDLSCPGLFKCSVEGICLDQSYVCDGTVHCKKSFDDEALCSLRKCPQGCVCQGRSATCTDPADHTLPSIPFDIRSLQVVTNTNETVRLWFRDFVYLGRLQLANLSIDSIPSDLFANLHNLLLLDLGNNLLTTIRKGMFFGLGNLQHLNLSGNPIHTLGESAFNGLSSIRYLYLNEMKINKISGGCFRGLHSVKRLSLAYNFIQNISASAWEGIEHLKWLNIEGNKLEDMSQQTFDNIKLDELHTSHFKFCCLARYVGNCTPNGDAFSSCDDLMKDKFLRVAVWVVGVTAIAGNIGVIVVRLATRCKQTTSILIINLSISDLLMGVYLLIIGSADVTYRERYVFFAEQWLASGMCKTAAFLSTLSSEMSIFLIVVIVAEPLLSLVLPITAKRLSFKTLLLVISLGWSLFSVLSALPLVGLPYFGKSYIRNGDCLLFNLSSGKIPGWEYSTLMFMLFNISGFVFLLVAYIYIYCFLDKTSKAAKRAAGDKDLELAERFVLIVVTDCLCWLPIFFTSFLSLSGILVNPAVSVWISVLFLPIHSALNPFLYTFSALRQIKEHRKIKRTGRSS